MSKNAGRIPHGGVHSVPNRSESGRTPARRGRPELEGDTPVNIENGLYRDNGEGVAATPLPYPLEVGMRTRIGFRGIRLQFSSESSLRRFSACVIIRFMNRIASLSLI